MDDGIDRIPHRAESLRVAQLPTALLEVAVEVEQHAIAVRDAPGDDRLDLVSETRRDGVVEEGPRILAVVRECTLEHVAPAGTRVSSQYETARQISG